MKKNGTHFIGKPAIEVFRAKDGQAIKKDLCVLIYTSIYDKGPNCFGFCSHGGPSIRWARMYLSHLLFNVALNNPNKTILLVLFQRFVH